jgi:hypothetical protein
MLQIITATQISSFTIYQVIENQDPGCFVSNY